MHITVFSTRPFEKDYLQPASKGLHKLNWLTECLSPDTAAMAENCDAVLISANDQANAENLRALKNAGIRFLSTRSAGYNHIDLTVARELGIRVGYVPVYSPFAIAEHAVGMMLALNRRFREGQSRILNGNYCLEGMTGFDMNRSTVGIIGTGYTGSAAARILNGFGCKLLGYDIKPDNALVRNFELQYTDLDELLCRSDIVTIHLPLTESTRYLINKDTLARMKPGAMLINTARGEIVNTRDALDALNNGRLGYLGIDVYENEKDLFGKKAETDPIKKDLLLDTIATHPNGMVTAHQAFLTRTALQNIAETSFYNINAWTNGFRSKNELA